VLPGVALEALQVHRIQQEQIRVNMGEKWQDKGLVFCDGYGGFFSPDMVLRRFDKLLDEAGLPHMRFHDLRHSAATILLVAGVHPKVVQERLGHSTSMRCEMGPVERLETTWTREGKVTV